MSTFLAECLIFRQQGLVSEYFEKYPSYVLTQMDSNLDLHTGQEGLGTKFSALFPGADACKNNYKNCMRLFVKKVSQGSAG